ncbi:MAG: sulfotransferase [Acidimicrobiales bacterium]|nr:sulfotransferase [Acidimicrobiales bacterium]
MPLEVIGAGFGRTGTLSTKTALERLGLDRCYHMLEVGLHADHAASWRRAARGEDVDWERHFKGYRATVDWPACAFWPQLRAAFPAAKVLLTVREPDAWCASFRETIARVIEPPFPAGAEEILAMAAEVIIDGTLDGVLGDDDHLMDCFVRHNQRVIDTVDADQLLVFDVRDGWEPLCEFLGRSVPDGPFPNVNDRAFFNALIEGGARPPIAAIEER